MNAQRRAWMLGGMMSGAAAAAAWATPTRFMAQESPMPPLADLFGRTAGEWQGRPAQAGWVVSPDVQAVLATLYEQTLALHFEHPRLGAVMLAAAYGGDQSDATRAHRPEVCYPAQGFTVNEVHRQTVQLGPAEGGQPLAVKRLVATLGSRHEPVSYWINVGGRVATSAWEQKKAQMRHGLRGLVPDGLLVRVSSLDRSAQRGWWLQARFLDDWWRHLSPGARRRIFGGETA